MQFEDLSTDRAKIHLHNMDCMDALREMEDNQFDLAIVDPPYGIGAAEDKRGGQQHGKAAAPSKSYGAKMWDSGTPPVEYFEELRRVSKHQIIWGANHMMEKIMRGSPSWIIWDKQNGDNGYADAELAYTSHEKAARIFKFQWAGMLQGDMANKEARIHPTQKPVALYKWLLTNYAKPGQTILDTHLGSGSIAIACHDLGFDLTGYELDADYFKAACERVRKHQSQEQFDFA